MEDKGIILSEKYGVNPSITHCECCGKEIGIALLGKLKNDEKAPKDVYVGLCENCQEVVDAGGVLFVEVKDGETGDNPYRTGRITGISKQGKERLFSEASDMLNKGPIFYMEESLFSKLFDQEIFKENDTTRSN